jgi:hypothetical protein
VDAFSIDPGSLSDAYVSAEGLCRVNPRRRVLRCGVAGHGRFQTNTGVFVVLTAEPHPDLDIPGEPFSFGVLAAISASSQIGSNRRRLSKSAR